MSQSYSNRHRDDDSRGNRSQQQRGDRPQNHSSQNRRPPAEIIETGVTGTVKNWQHDKKFGFITRDDGRGDVFVHFTGITDVGKYRELKQGERVQFDLAKGDQGKGPKAENTRVIG
jgi:cold shock protein